MINTEMDRIDAVYFCVLTKSKKYYIKEEIKLTQKNEIKSYNHIRNEQKRGTVRKIRARKTDEDFLLRDGFRREGGLYDE